MLLAIDIGNTSASFAVFSQDKLKSSFRMATGRLDYKKFLQRQLCGKKITDVIIASVVPEATKKMQRSLESFVGKKPIIIGKDFVVPIKNRYKNPRQVGQDRLVNAFAAVKLYGAPAVIVDYGTAVTFDIVSKKQDYLGGMILPGIDISLDALARRTALLPKVKLKPPSQLIGTDTKESIRSGIVYGFAALTDDLIRKIKTKIGKNAKVIGTGGNVRLIKKYCRCFGAIDINLTLKGLNLCYQAFLALRS